MRAAYEANRSKYEKMSEGELREELQKMCDDLLGGRPSRNNDWSAWFELGRRHELPAANGDHKRPGQPEP